MDIIQEKPPGKIAREPEFLFPEPKLYQKSRPRKLQTTYNNSKGNSGNSILKTKFYPIPEILEN